MLDVEQRLSKLEQSARRWRAAAMVLAVGMVCVVGMGADEGFPKAIRANAFIVTDEQGKSVGVFGFLGKGDDVRLGLMGRDGKSNVVVIPGAGAIKATAPDGTVKYIE